MRYQTENFTEFLIPKFPKNFSPQNFQYVRKMFHPKISKFFFNSKISRFFAYFQIFLISEIPKIFDFFYVIYLFLDNVPQRTLLEIC